MFQIQSEQYSGPFDLLLQMIEGKKLEITEVSLSSITNDFLEYVRSLQEKDYEEIGAFLVTAARLIFIKSKEILPKLEIEELDEEGNLELQLKIYREIKRISKFVAELYLKNPMWGRGFLEGYAPSFLPAPNLTSEHVKKALSHFLISQTQIPVETMERRVVTIEEKVEDILKKLSRGSHFRFGELLSEKDRIEVIVLFLALLELMKTGVISPHQSEQFGEITVSRHGLGDYPSSM